MQTETLHSAAACAAQPGRSWLCACMAHSELLLTCPALRCRGFTSFAREDYVQWKKEGRLMNDGVNAKVCTRSQSLRLGLTQLEACTSNCSYWPD